MALSLRRSNGDVHSFCCAWFGDASDQTARFWDDLDQLSVKDERKAHREGGRALAGAGFGPIEDENVPLEADCHGFGALGAGDGQDELRGTLLDVNSQLLVACSLQMVLSDNHVGVRSHLGSVRLGQANADLSFAVRGGHLRRRERERKLPLHVLAFGLSPTLERLSQREDLSLG